MTARSLLGLFSILFALGVPPLALAQATTPLEDFAKPPDFVNAKLSPNGDYVALSTQSGDDAGLAIIRLSDFKLTSGARAPKGGAIANFWWGSPDRVIYSIATRYGSLAAPAATGELLTVNTDGSGRRYLFGHRKATAEMVTPLPHDARHALVKVNEFLDRGNVLSISDDIPGQLKRINLDTGKTFRLSRAPISGRVRYLTDDEGKTLLAFGTDPQSTESVSFQKLGDSDWRPLQVDAGDVHFSSFAPMHITPDGSTAFLSAAKGEAGLRCLISLDTQSSKARELACHDSADVADLFMASDTVTPLAAVFEAGKPELMAITPDHPEAQLLVSLQNSFPGQVVVPTSWSAKGDKALLYVYSDRNPGGFFLFDVPAKKAVRLVSRRSWIDPKEMAERRPIAFPARDGTTLYGFLTLPPNRKPDGLPIVVMPHGGPFGLKDDWAWEPDAQAIASRGYAVLQVNFRGSGGYGDAYQEAGRYQWGGLMIDDITDGAQWAVSQGYADPERRCIYGGSYGGYAAMMSAVREPELYRCVIAFVGVYDLKSWAGSTDVDESLRGRNFIRNYVARDEKEMQQQSPLHWLDRLVAPVMIIHGEQDKRVPYSQATALKAALEARDHPYQWLVEANEGHGFYKTDNRTKMYKKMIAFLDQHIGGSSAP